MWQRVRAHGAELLCGGILMVMALQTLAVIARKSITNDEVGIIPAGYYHLVAGNFQISMDHPPLTKMVAALPMLLIQPNEPSLESAKGEESLLSIRAHEEFLTNQGNFWIANREYFHAISYWSRVPMIALMLLLGILIFVYTRQVFGVRAALISVGLFSIEPNVLAHGRTALNDLPAALAYLLFFFSIYRYLQIPNFRRALLLGLVTGLAIVTKFSLIIAAPIFVCVGIFSVWRAPRWNEERTRVTAWFGLASLAALLTINSVYYFQGDSGVAASQFRWLSSIFSGELLNLALKGVRALSLIVPSYLLAGVDAVLARNRFGHPASLLGMHSTLGWWYYFPVAFALKTTIPFLFISIAALCWSIWRLTTKKETILLYLLIPFFIYVAMALTSHIDIGIRHLLPVFPFLFILGGAFLARLTLQTRAAKVLIILVAILLGWSGVEAVRAFPNHMSYMNELAWQHPHWYYLSDSNVEWGDDVPELANYLRQHGETKVRAALLGGWATLPYYGVEYIDMQVSPDVQLTKTRYVAIGASFLNGSTVSIAPPGRSSADFFDEYRNRVPEAVFGNSIYLFREHE